MSTATTVVGRTTQTGSGGDSSTLYYPGAKVCRFGHCDFNTDVVPCNPGDIIQDNNGVSCVSGFCTRQNACYSLNPNICPVLNGLVTGTASWASNLNLFGAAPVNCSYPSSAFNNIANVSAFINTFGANSSYVNTIMPNFCIQQSTTCIIFPELPGAPIPSTSLIQPGGTFASLIPQNQPIPGCSNFNDSGTAGQLCRQWAAANVPLADNAYNNYCDIYDTPDCSCVNRRLNTVYESIKTSGLSNVNDNCWYLPCQDTSQYLVPSNISSQSCPSAICQQVQAAINTSGQVNFGPVTESQNCTFVGPSSNSSNTNTTGGGGTVNPPVVPPSTGATTTPSSFWDKYKWWIIGLGIVILLIVIVFVVLKARKPKLSSEKPLPTEKPIVKSSQKKPAVTKEKVTKTKTS